MFKKSLVAFIVAALGLKLLSVIIDYWITSTIPDDIEYYEADPYYFRESKNVINKINKL